MFCISRRKTEKRNLYRLLVLVFFFVSFQSFGQNKQLLHNGFAKVGVYPDLNIPFNKDFTTNSGVGTDFVIGARILYFFTLSTGFYYHYQETKMKRPEEATAGIFPYPPTLNDGIKKRKFRFNSIGIPFEAKFFFPIDFSRDAGATDIFLGYTGTLLFNGGDQLWDTFNNRERLITSINQTNIRSHHRFMLGTSINAGDQGDLDISLNLGFMAGHQYSFGNHFSLGIGLAYRIYWLDWDHAKSSAKRRTKRALNIK